jgi:hypothetical protein
MESPIVAPARVVIERAAVFHDLFDNQCQFWHFQHYPTGLILLPNKSMAHMTRCILHSADKTNLSRFLLARLLPSEPFPRVRGLGNRIFYGEIAASTPGQ